MRQRYFFRVGASRAPPARGKHSQSHQATWNPRVAARRPWMQVRASDWEYPVIHKKSAPSILVSCSTFHSSSALSPSVLLMGGEMVDGTVSNKMGLVGLTMVVAVMTCQMGFSQAELPKLEHPSRGDVSLRLLVVGDWGRKGLYNQSQVSYQVCGTWFCFCIFAMWVVSLWWWMYCYLWWM